jgi:hypothetical protein
MTSLEMAADAMPDRSILWADFDAMLIDMSGGLRRLACHFSLAAGAEEIKDWYRGR